MLKGDKEVLKGNEEALEYDACVKRRRGSNKGDGKALNGNRHAFDVKVRRKGVKKGDGEVLKCYGGTLKDDGGETLNCDGDVLKDFWEVLDGDARCNSATERC